MTRIIEVKESGKINISLEKGDVKLDGDFPVVELPVEVLVIAVQDYVEKTGLEKFCELMKEIK